MKATKKKEKKTKIAKKQKISQIKIKSYCSLKKKWLEELRYKKVILERIKKRNAKIRNNRMLKEDEGIFYRKTKEKNKRNGKTPNFWAEIWKDNAKTS